MSPGEVLLALAVVSALAVFATGAAGLRYESDRLRTISRYASWLTFGLITATFGLLAFLFLTSDMSYQYVWSHSATGLDAFYKLVGVWAGGEGGLVVWAWFLSLALVVEVALERRRAMGPKFASAFRMGMGSMVLLFSIILLTAGLFDPTSTIDLAAFPNGLGMNMSLQTIEMAIHPPLIFSGYAFCAAVFSASLGRLVTGERRWTEVAVPWSWLSAIVLSLGIVVGGLWAYYELGWGGFWVWDPVETASLLPWLVIMAFLHANRSRGARDGALMPFLGMLSLVMVMLTAFITRSGGLWGSSVHTYGSSVEGSLGSRFIEVLLGDKGVMGLFMVTILLLIITLALSYRMNRQHKEEVDNGTIIIVGSLLLYAAFLVLLLVKNAGLDQESNFIEFTEKTTVLVVIIMGALVMGLSRSRLGTRRSAYLGAGIVLGGGLAAAIALATGSVPWLLALMLPPSLAVIAVSGYRMWRIGRRGAREWLSRAGPHITHIGIAVVLVCFIATSTLQSSLPGGAEALSVGGEVSIDGYTIQLVGLTADPWTTPSGGAGEVRTATFTISAHGTVRSASVSNHYELGNSTSGDNALHSGTLIMPGLAQDLYVNFEWMGSGTILLHARVLPAVSGVWAGAILVILGLVSSVDLRRTHRNEISG